MEKRYQVFISSTYADLQEERQEVMQALLELECIPAGMELFPAANEDQWTLIKKVIDDCDYYILIMAGRYGSIGPSGQSYTEMEYRYALETGKPVIGFIHENPGTLPANRCELSEEGKAKLDVFREFVKKKVCRFWDSPADLGSKVSRSLINLIKTHPGVGWVRANLVPEQSSAEEILELRKTIEQLEAELEDARTHAPAGADALAGGGDEFAMDYFFRASKDSYYSSSQKYDASFFISWDDLFANLAPLMIDQASESQLKLVLNSIVQTLAHAKLKKKGSGFNELHLSNFEASEDAFQTIKIQLRALGLITKSTKAKSVKDNATYWTLTPYGDTRMTQLRAIRKEPPSDTLSEVFGEKRAARSAR